jgi:hypothetical protein
MPRVVKDAEGKGEGGRNTGSYLFFAVARAIVRKLKMSPPTCGTLVGDSLNRLNRLNLRGVL